LFGGSEQRFDANFVLPSVAKFSRVPSIRRRLQAKLGQSVAYLSDGKSKTSPVLLGFLKAVYINPGIATTQQFRIYFPVIGFVTGLAASFL
jgi:hypothetical protein